MSPIRKFASAVCAAACVYAFSACSLRGIRVEDLPEPTIRSSWTHSGIRDERAAFTQYFCQELSQVSPEVDCPQWLWKPPTQVVAATNPAAGIVSRRTLIIAPGIFGECVAPWVTPFSADYSALEGRGYRIKILPLEGRASAARNARIIHEHLSDPSLALADALVIAYSKGSSDFMLAASQPESATWRDRISAFVSVAGTPHGSPAANHGADLYRNLLAKIPLDACDRSDGGGIQSLTYAETRRIAEAFVESKPPFATYSVAAVAADGPINPLLKGFHRWLSRIDERNDGQVLLEDAIVPQSTVLGVFRADHWSIALPFEESSAFQMKPLGYNNHFPRGALVRAIVEFTAPVSIWATTEQEP